MNEGIGWRVWCWVSFLNPTYKLQAFECGMRNSEHGLGTYHETVTEIKGILGE